MKHPGSREYLLISGIVRLVTAYTGLASAPDPALIVKMFCAPKMPLHGFRPQDFATTSKIDVRAMIV
jgi:hypothetical protein